MDTHTNAGSTTPNETARVHAQRNVGTPSASRDRPQRLRQEARFSKARDGGEIATLLDQDGRTVVVDAADYRRLVALGFTGRWFTNEVTKGYRYVRLNRDPRETGGQALFTISRLILGAGERQSVRHRDGNRLNLRRSNMALRGGKGGTGARAALQTAQEGGADAR